MADPDVIQVLERGLGGVAPGFMIYNCAAEFGGRFLDVDLEKQRTNILVNCWTPVQLAHHFGGKMCAEGRGGVVICSSLAGEQGIYHWASSGTAKAFEMILGEGLWYEFRLKGVDCTSFMIGSNYTPNFQRDQRAKNSIFAETNRPANLPEGVPVPQLPEEAAESLFQQLEGDWKPRTYANPLDEARCKELAKQPREAVINRMSDSQRLGWETMAKQGLS
jgi:NAD(P)-dependent dehydrogenase (short-subunit alcohol dehydrogenase family)